MKTKLNTMVYVLGMFASVSAGASTLKTGSHGQIQSYQEISGQAWQCEVRNPAKNLVARANQQGGTRTQAPGKVVGAQ